MTRTVQIRKKGTLTLPMELRKRYQLDRRPQNKSPIFVTFSSKDFYPDSELGEESAKKLC